MSIKINVNNPTLFDESQTVLKSDATDGDLTLTVDSTDKFSADDYIVLGNLGEDMTELLQVQTVTDDNTLTLTGAIKFNHNKNDPVAESPYNQAKLYKYTDESGAGATLVITVDIDFQNQLDVTNIYDSGSSTNYYYRVVFYNEHTTTYSDYSDYLSGADKHFCTVKSVYQKCGMAEEVVPYDTAFLAVTEAEDTVRMMYKNTFQADQTDTIYLNGDGDKVIFVPDRYLPMQTITELVQLDQAGSTAYTFAASDYQYDSTTGMIRLRESIYVGQLERAFLNGYQNVKVGLTYGYSEVPQWVQDLTRSIAGLNVINYKITGSYTDVSTWSEGSMSYSLGQPYVNLDAGFRRLNDNVQRIIDIHKPCFVDDEGS